MCAFHLVAPKSRGGGEEEEGVTVTPNEEEASPSIGQPVYLESRPQPGRTPVGVGGGQACRSDKLPVLLSGGDAYLLRLHSAEDGTESKGEERQKATERREEEK